MSSRDPRLKKKGLNKRQAILTAFKAIGMPVTDEDLIDLRGLKKTRGGSRNEQ